MAYILFAPKMLISWKMVLEACCKQSQHPPMTRAPVFAFLCVLNGELLGYAAIRRGVIVDTRPGCLGRPGSIRRGSPSVPDRASLAR